MKKYCLILIALIVQFTNSYSQEQVGIRAPYGGWRRVDLNAAYVSISFSLSKCRTDKNYKGMIAGESYYRIRVQFPQKGFLKFKFDYFTCDGKRKTENVIVDMSKGGIDAGQGMWFLGYDVTTPYDVQGDEKAQDIRKDEIDGETKSLVKVGSSVSLGTSSSKTPHTNTSTSNSNSSSKSTTQTTTNNDTKSSSTSKYVVTRTDEQIKADEEKAARDKRVNDALTESKNADFAMGAAAIGTVAIASVMKDNYQDNFAYMKFHLGLGWENIPIITNDDVHFKTYTSVTSHPTIYLGLQTGIFNDKGISLHIKPYFSFGMNALSPGTNGTHFSYGGVSTLFLGKHADSKFKIFAEGGFIKRSGSYTCDMDATAASIGIYTARNIVQTADYNYSILRYGGGLMLHLIKDDEETNIKPGIFYEKPSFANGSKPMMYANIEVLFSSFMIIEFGYSNKYAISGTGKYFTNFNKEDKDYFLIRFIKTGKIF